MASIRRERYRYCGCRGFVASFYLTDVQESGDLRSGDDDLGINQFLIEFGVLALLIGGSNEGMALVLEPFPYPQFILCRPNHFGVVPGVLSAIVKDKKYFSLQLKVLCQFAPLNGLITIQ